MPRAQNPLRLLSGIAGSHDREVRPLRGIAGLLVYAALIAGGSLAACSSDSTMESTTPVDADGGDPSTDGGKDVNPSDGAGEAWNDAIRAIQEINECTKSTYLDRTAEGADRTIAWGFSIPTDSERCMVIKKGQRITFNGNFVIHPLDGKGGDTPNPISAPPDAGSAESDAGIDYDVNFATTG